MSHEYQINSGRNLVTLVFNGVTSAEETISAISTILNDPLYRSGMDAISEFADASGDWSLAELDQLRRFLTSIRDQVGRSNWAVVIPEGKSTRSARLLVALHNAFDSTIRIKIFRSQEAARDWLELLAPTMKTE